MTLKLFADNSFRCISARSTTLQEVSWFSDS